MIRFARNTETAKAKPVSTGSADAVEKASDLPVKASAEPKQRKGKVDIAADDESSDQLL
nr:hypothetical protein [Marinicella sp. W31]MDC2879599.1 hypothetical protein [Marinicella sp. W31]